MARSARPTQWLCQLSRERASRLLRALARQHASKMESHSSNRMEFSHGARRQSHVFDVPSGQVTPPTMARTRPALVPE